MKFKVFPCFDEVKTDIDSNLQVTVKGEGESRLLYFDKPVRLLELSKSEALKIAFALLGRIAICEICDSPYRRKASTGLYVKTRFCSRECFYEWCRRTGGSLGKSGLQTLMQAQWSPDKLKGINVVEVTT